MLEIVIVISILALLSSVVMTSFSKYRNNNLLILNTENLVSLITKARADTFFSKNDDVYGIRIESGRAVLFKGGIFGEPNADNIEITFDSQITASDISLNGGGSDIIFQRLSGKTDHYGTITMSIVSGDTQNVVHIYETGLVDVN